MNIWKSATIILFIILVFTQLFSINLSISPKFGSKSAKEQSTTVQSSAVQTANIDQASLQNEVLPAQGVDLPLKWGDLGKKLVADGVLDPQKLEQSLGTISSQDKQLYTGNVQTIHLTQQNAPLILDLFWALGLSNKDGILSTGPIAQDPKNLNNYASTGGFDPLTSGKALDHFNKLSLITLNSSQEQLVKEVAQNIYRPCCGQNVMFPDCNHGMAMLGALELGTVQGLTKDQLYQMALELNSAWFPQTYLDLATYFKEQGQDWNKVSPEVILSEKYSSAQGYSNTRSQIKSLPQSPSSGSSC